MVERSKNVGLRDLVGAGLRPAPVQLPSERQGRGIAEVPLPLTPASTTGAVVPKRRSAVASATVPRLRRLHEVRGKGLAGQLALSYGNEGRRGLKMLAIAGGIAVLILALLPVSGAVVISGSMTVGSNAKKIQHPVGGVIAQVLVKDGDRVQSGMPLVRLHEVLAKTTLTTITRQADESAARIARLRAERDGSETPQWPTQLAARAAEADVAQLLGSEVAQFEARARLRKRQADVLKEHVVQLREQIVGLTAQLVSREAQAGHVAAELAGLEKLYAQALVPLPRISGVRREAARLEGERHQLRSSIAETRSKVSEAEMQIVAQDETQRAEVAKEISEHQSKQSEIGDRQVAARDQYKRHEVLAPVTGVVTQLAVHTVGGVVGPGDVMMLVVPENEDLIFEARLATKDIDQATVGQPATLRFPALNRASTPELRGAVSYVSADASRDPQTGGTYYTVRVAITEQELARLDTSMHLQPGMPVEAFLETGSRSIASYLLKPFTDQLQRVFRER
jgi:HlyD family secretion protein